MISKTKTFAAVLALGASLASPAFAGDAETCKKVRFADVGWTDIQVTTGATQVVLEALGYEPEVSTLSVPVTLNALKESQIDAFLGNWMPSMTADIQPFLDEKSVEQLSVNLEGAGYGACEGIGFPPALWLIDKVLDARP